MSHHEIIDLIEPFTRRGIRVDLAQSDRSKRSLAFKPVEHGEDSCSLGGICKRLQLDNPAPGAYRLTRTLTHSSGLKATLQTDGPETEELLARIESVPASRQFRSQSGSVIALSYRLMRVAGAGSGAQQARMVLTRAETQLDGLSLTLKDTCLSGYPADIDLVPQVGYSFQFPDDLFAVLGKGWGILRKHRSGWSGSLGVRGGAFDRSQQIESMFESLVAHLKATLAAPPARFHETLLRARWGVALKRAAPLLIYLALLAGAAGLSFVPIPEDSIVRILVWFMPTALMFGVFTMRDRPRLEIPTLPRRLHSTAWRPAPPTGSIE